MHPVHTTQLSEAQNPCEGYPESEHHACELFHHIDADNSGEIDAQEGTDAIMGMIVEHLEPHVYEEVQHFIADNDHDANGHMNYEEFMHALHNAEEHEHDEEHHEA